MSAIVTEQKTSWLDRPVLAIMKLDAEKTLYVVFILLAIFTRFWMLGARTMSHDESLHTYYSWNLYKGGGFSHTPLMHGSFKFLANAGVYTLFGADDFTARISTALFGIALVALPYFLRRWLGRTGALITSFMLLISPSILYHARYIRDEAFMLVWGLLMAWAIFSYLRTRAVKWLILLAAVMGLMFVTMEAAFIFTAIDGFFLIVVLLIELSKRANFWRDVVLKLALGGGGAILIVMILIVIQSIVLGAIGLGPGDQSPFPVPVQPLPGSPVEFSAQAQYIVQLIGAVLRVGLSMLIPAIAIGLAVYYWLKSMWPAEARESAAFDLIIILGTLSLFMLSAGVLPTLNSVWQVLFHSPFVDVKFFADGNFPTNDVGLVLRVAAVAFGFVAAAIAIGWWWHRRRWVLLAGLFVGIGVTFFTTVFTNGVGLGTGFVGSLGYWLVQQGVARGTQPIYYYFIITPVYEYFPMLVAIGATIVYVVRAIRQRGWAGAGLDWDQRLFVPFLVYWCAASWIAYSYAGEKMPWLMVYLALPMIVLSGRFLGEWFERIDWRAIVRERHWLAGLLFAAAVVSGAWLIGNLQKAFGGLQQDSLIAFSNWFAALIVFALSAWAVWRMTPRPTWRALACVSALIGLIVLAVMTIRTAWVWNYINYDSAVEFGVYAHGGPGVKIAMQQIDDLAQRTGEGKAIKIGFDSESSWPYYWYLRDYTNKFQMSDSPSRADLDAPILIVSDKVWNQVDNALRNTHTQWQSHRIWWPMEDYKVFADCPATEASPNGQVINVAEYDENGDGQIDTAETQRGKDRCTVYNLRHIPDDLGILWRWATDPDRRSAILDIFLNRDYTKYDQIRSRTDRPDNWPLTSDFRLYVRRDLAAQVWTEAIGGVVPTTTITQTDPYAQGWQDVTATLTFGATGTGNGQLQAPHGISVAPDGSIYVADSLNHRIQKFDQDGNFAAVFGGPEASVQAGLFREPWDVAIGPDGLIYVADTWNHRIQKLNTNGALIKAWGTNVDTGGQATGAEGAFYGPRGIAVDATGRVLVADTGNKRVQIFKDDSTFISQFGGSGLDQGRLDEPVGIATDPKGNIVVADTWNGRVQVFDPNGQPLSAWEIDGWLDKDRVGKPYLAADQQSRIYVADEASNRVLIFDESGKYLGGFGQYGTDEHGFVAISGIALDTAGNIYVVDSGTGRVLKYPPFQPSAK
jgi:uncharacterized protein (TIGR03663 family)